jgi:uncharacterized membrane protein YjjB (DUF3815 family)
MVPLSAAAYFFTRQFSGMARSVILIGLLALLGLVVVIIARRYRREAVFVVGLSVFSFLAVCPGFYFREHYFIFLLPAIAILAGSGLADINDLLVGQSSAFHRRLITVLIGLAAVGLTLFQQRIYLFYNTPARICRLIYGGNPFPESPKIAEFIQANCAATDTVAVIGSEPQIYFYSNRRSATRYIYVYPLMEVDDYAAVMQNEMIGEIESAQPELMVFVNVRTSWLKRPDSVQLIFEWLNSYCPKFYDLVGVVDIFLSGRTVYRWNQEAVDYKPTAECWVAVYKRKRLLMSF